MNRPALPLIALMLLANAAHGQTVLEFGSETCGSCQDMKPTVAQLRSEGYRFEYSNTDKEPELATRFKITRLPTYVAFDNASNREVGRIVGGGDIGPLRALAQRVRGIAKQPASVVQEPAWRQFNPPGSVNGQGMFHDVVSRLDAQGRQTMQDPDPITYAHEGTHWLHSMIRNQYPGGTGTYNAFYVGGGRSIVFREPNCTIQQAVQFIPPQLRNHTLFKTYFVDSLNDWNSRPLYIFDEWSAYINGVQVSQETGYRRGGSDIPFAHVFVHYSAAVIEAIKQYDPSYPELAALENFAAWQEDRLNSLAGPTVARCVCCPTIGQRIIRRILPGRPNRQQPVIIRPTPNHNPPSGPIVTLPPQTPLSPTDINPGWPPQPPGAEIDPGPPVEPSPGPGQPMDPPTNPAGPAETQPAVPAVTDEKIDQWNQTLNQVVNVTNQTNSEINSLTIALEKQPTPEKYDDSKLVAILNQQTQILQALTIKIDQLQPAGGTSTATVPPVFYDIRPRRN
jgi:thiol-disulfide isomerase/thioredoxin